jgi:hypothetical protein
LNKEAIANMWYFLAWIVVGRHMGNALVCPEPTHLAWVELFIDRDN